MNKLNKFMFWKHEIEILIFLTYKNKYATLIKYLTSKRINMYLNIIGNIIFQHIYINSS
jgi:hypothetical protein